MRSLPRCIGALFLFLLTSAAPASAQYALNETGAMAGGGACLMNGAGPAAYVSGFFSHYTCGKAYGFHFTGGVVMMANHSQTVFQNNLPVGPLESNAALTFGIAYVGAYFKIRPHTYHRPREIAFLFGPQAEIPFLARYTYLGTRGSVKDAGGRVNTFIPAGHASVQIRRPLGKEHSFFIEPGIDIQFSALYYNALNLPNNCMRFTLGMGVKIWDDH